MKPKTQYRPKAKQSNDVTSNSIKMTSFVGRNKALTSCYNKESPSNNGYSFFSLSKSFAALNDENPIIKKVGKGSKATTSSTQEEGKSSTLLVERINVFEKHILKGKLVLVDDIGKPLERVDYPDNLGSDDEVEPVDNETASYLTSKLMGVGYGLNSLLEQWMENEVDDDYDPYDDDMC
ncbi:hypothetical protein Tco_0483681 [Tanacetum coccineum]